LFPQNLQSFSFFHKISERKSITESQKTLNKPWGFNRKQVKKIHGFSLHIIYYSRLLPVRDGIRDYFSFITISALAAIFPHTSTFCKMIG